MRIILLALIFLISCDHSSDKVAELTKELQRSVEKLSPKTDEVQNMASEEVDKLMSFEYQVFELPPESSTAVLNGKLNMLGRERWECFDVESDEEQIRIYCKRRPKTYLRYLLRAF